MAKNDKMAQPPGGRRREKARVADETTFDRILTTLKKHRVSAVVLILGIALAAAASFTNSLRDIKQFLADLQGSPASEPLWLTHLSHAPIVPGRSIADIEIGHNEQEVVRVLGQPPGGAIQVIGDDNEIFLDDRLGAVVHYALQYRYKGIFLGIYTDRDTRRVKRMRLTCSRVDDCQSLPSFHGVSLGVPREFLIRELGLPMTSETHGGCSGNRSLSYVYEGIVFYVCLSDNLVYMLDVYEFQGSSLDNASDSAGHAN